MEAAFWKKKRACTQVLLGVLGEAAQPGWAPLGAVVVRCLPPTSLRPQLTHITWGTLLCLTWILTGLHWEPGAHLTVRPGKTGVHTLGRPVQWAQCPWTTCPQAPRLSALQTTAIWAPPAAQATAVACQPPPVSHLSPSTPAPLVPVLPAGAATAPTHGCARLCRWPVSSNPAPHCSFPPFFSLGPPALLLFTTPAPQESSAKQPTA